MSFYLKYRPQGFASLVGQDHIKNTLQNSLKLNRFSHAYLFCGSRGTGKTSTARILAKALNCTNLDTEKLEPCLECEMCQAISSGNLIDVIEIDAASNRGIDEIRELRETIKFSPTQAKNKVYIIDEVHMLTKEAFNALLKTLEEPPANVYFILATTEVHKIPDTIISRCQRFDFKRMSTKDLVSRLEFIAKSEKLKFEEEALLMISKAVNGGMRDAISILEQLASYGEITSENTKNLLGSTSNETVVEFVEALLNQENQTALDIIQNVHKEAIDFDKFRKDLLNKLRDYLLASIQANDSQKQKHLAWIIESLQKLNQDFKGCSIPQLSLEVLVAKQASFGQGIDKEKSVEKTKTSVVKSQVETKKEVPNMVEDVAAEDVAKENTVEENTIREETSKVEAIKTPNETKEKEEIKETLQKEKPAAKVIPQEVVVEEKLKNEAIKEETVKATPKSNGNLSSDWTSIINNIPKTAIKILLQQTTALSFEGEKLTVGVASSFYLDKLSKSETLNLIEGTAEETLSQKVKIEFTKVAAQEIPKVTVEAKKPEAVVAPTQVANTDKQVEKEKIEAKDGQKSEENSQASIVDEALALFADEIELE